jgi:hypothetical protein
MARSNKADKARQLNAAHAMLQRNIPLPEAMQRLSRAFDLSAALYVREYRQTWPDSMVFRHKWMTSIFLVGFIVPLASQKKPYAVIS